MLPDNVDNPNELVPVVICVRDSYLVIAENITLRLFDSKNNECVESYADIKCVKCDVTQCNDSGI